MGFKQKKVDLETEQKILGLFNFGKTISEISKQLYNKEKTSGDKSYRGFYGCVYRICKKGGYIRGD